MDHTTYIHILKMLASILPNIATILLVACYIPQIVHLYKVKKTEGLSVYFWVILILALFTFTLYNVVLFLLYGTFFGIITEGLNTLLAVVVFSLLLRYRQR